MKLSFRYLLVALVLIVGTTAALGQWSQASVNSVVYDTYTVRQGETIYSLAKSLGLTREQIIEYNPDVAEGLKAGSVLYFPVGVVKKHDSGSDAIVIPENVPTTIHQVKKKESVYGIAKQYGITIEQLFALNPSAKEGIKKGEKLIIPIFGTSDQSEVAAQQTEPKPYPGRVNTDFYTVRQGDTFYSIAWNHGLAQKDLESLNPEVNPERLQPGQLLRLRKRAPEIVYQGVEGSSSATTPTATPSETPTESSAATTTLDIPTTTSTTETPVAPVEPTTPSSSITPETAKVPVAQENGVAQTNGVPQPNQAAPVVEETLVQETVEVVGTPVEAPQQPAQETPRAQSEITLPVAQEYTLGTVNADPVAIEQNDTLVQAQDKPLSIVVMLPFMLNEATPSKLALRYLDFYKGLLIAADSLSHNGLKQVKIVAYDTEGSTDRVRYLLEDPEVVNASVVIAPDVDEQLQLIAEKGNEVGYYTFNIYNVKDESFMTNPKMMQANINHRQMYSKAIEAMERRYPNTTLVILNNEGGRNEKMEFVETVRRHYQNKGKNVLEIKYNGNLPIESLDTLSVATPYLFLPVSGSNQEFGRIYPALKYFRENVAIPSDVLVFGYPDWSAFRADRLEELHRLNAVIYSRFYDDVQSSQSQGVAQAFNRWYGQEMEDGVPKPGLMGFDVGTYLIKALRANDGDFNNFTPVEQGVQSTFNFRHPDGGQGLVNDALYIVDFYPDRSIVKTVN